jgi:hypothetical protein
VFLLVVVAHGGTTAAAWGIYALADVMEVMVTSHSVDFQWEIGGIVLNSKAVLDAWRLTDFFGWTMLQVWLGLKTFNSLRRLPAEIDKLGGIE